MISGTITDLSGRTLSGQTPTAFWYSLRHARPFSVGLNCALGAKEMRAHIAELARIADTLICAYPNAGLPNEFGDYDESPEGMAGARRVRRGRPGQHRRRLLRHHAGAHPGDRRGVAACRRGWCRRPSRLRLSGLEPFMLTPEITFVNIGERTNVTGSAKFRKLIMAGDYAAALDVARDQVAERRPDHRRQHGRGPAGCEAAMVTFLNLIAAEPDIAACR